MSILQTESSVSFPQVPESMVSSVEVPGSGRPVGFVLSSLFLTTAIVFVTLSFVASINSRNVANQAIGGLTPNMVVVSPIPPSSTGIDFGASSQSLSLTDVITLTSPGYLDAASSIAPVTSAPALMRYAARSAHSLVIGTTGTYAATAGFSIASGRFLTPQDVATDSRVVVLGHTLVLELFGSVNPIGQTIFIAGNAFQVVGVLNSRGFSGTDNLDNRVIIPETTMWRVLLPGRGNPVSEILMRSNTVALAQQAAQQASAVLLARHQIANPYLADFSIITHSQLSAAQIVSGVAAKRILVLVSVLLLFLSSLHMFLVFGRNLYQGGNHAVTSSLGMFALFRVTSIGVVSSVVGVALGVLIVPLLPLLSPGINIASGLSLQDALLSLAIGVAFAVLSLLPQALKIGNRVSV